MNEQIDSYLPIVKYFERINECFQFSKNGKPLYMASQVIYKAHHAVLASIIYFDAWKELRKNPLNKQTWIGFKNFFVKENNYLKLNQKLSSWQKGYHSADAVVPAGEIDSALDNLSMAATADQGHVYQLMVSILHLTDTNKILWDQIKQLSKTNVILARQGQ